MTEKTLTGTGAPVSFNLWTFTKSIKVEGLWLIFTDVTNVVDIDDTGFDVFDGVNQVSLTTHNPGGLTLDGVSLDAFAYKESTAASALSLLNSDQVRIDEPANWVRFFSSAYLNGKNGATNYIKFRYDNADGNLNCKIMFFMDWVCLSLGSTVTAV